MKQLTPENTIKFKYRLTVTLNGTNENPWHRWQLRCNPFPQIAKYQWDRYESIIRELGGDPIPNVDYIRRKLEGFSPEFIELCCQQFHPGQLYSFDVYFND